MDKNAARRDLKVLDPRTISQGLGFLNVGLTPEEITNPQPDRMRALYAEVIIQIFGVPEESLVNLPLQACDGEVDHELYRNAIPAVMIYRMLSCILNDFLNFEFTMSDIILPQAKRTREILSDIVHYVRFNTPIDPLVGEILEEVNGEMVEMNHADEENAALEQMQAEAYREQDSRRRRENQLSEEKHMLNEELQSTLSRITEARKRTERASANKQDADNKRGMLQATAQELNAKLRYISEAIIDNPEEMLERRTAGLQEIASLKQALTDTHEQCARMDSMQQLLKQAAVVFEEHKRTGEEVVRLKNDLDMRIVDLGAAVREREKAAREIEKRNYDLEALKRRNEEEIKSHKVSHTNNEREMKELQEAIDRLSSEIVIMEAEQETKGTEAIRAKQKEILRVRSELAEIERRGRAEVEKARNRFLAIKQEVKKDEERWGQVYKLFEDSVAEARQGLDCDEVSVHNMSVVLSSADRRTLTSSSSQESINNTSFAKENVNTAFDAVVVNSLKAKRRNSRTNALHAPKNDPFNVTQTLGDRSFTGPLGRF